MKLNLRKHISKKELIKLASSFYILLISFLLVIMATYAWSTLSTAPQAGGAQTGIDMSGWISDAKQGYTAQVGTRWYKTLSEALTDQEEDAISLTLINDVQEDITIRNGQTVFLDLAGYTLKNESGDSITVERGATLFLSDTSSDHSGTVDNTTHQTAALFNNGTVEIYGGTFTRSQEISTPSASNSNSYYTVVNHGTMNIHDGIFSSNGSYSSLIENGYFNYTKSDPRVGHVEGLNDAKPVLSISGGKFIGGLHSVKNDDCGQLTISGGSFNDFAGAAVYNTNVATLTGGHFSVGDNADGYAVFNCNYTSMPNLSTLTVQGGIYYGTIRFGTTARISGGTFTVDVSQYLEEGYEQTRPDGSDSVYTVKKAAA